MIPEGLFSVFSDLKRLLLISPNFRIINVCDFEPLFAV